MKKLVSLLLLVAIFSSNAFAEDGQYKSISDNPKRFQIDTTSIIKDGNYVIFKYKDDFSPCRNCLFNYFIYTVRSQCNDINIELIDEEGQDHSDNQIKNTFLRNSLGNKYEPNKPYDLMTKYACNKANEIVKPTTNFPATFAVDDKKVKEAEEEEAQKLCKSYGLKKGTKDYADCMLKIREQNFAKELQLQKKSEEIAASEQALVDEKNKNQLSAIKATQEKRAKAEDKRVKDEQNLAIRQQMIDSAVRQCLMKAQMLYESTSDLVTTQIRNNNDQHLYFLMENMKHEASDKCRQNTGYADLMEKQIFSYSPQPATPAPKAVPNNLHCQTRAAGGQIYTDCY